MNKKFFWLIFSGIFLWTGIVLGQEKSLHDFLNQSDKVLSPRYPWYTDRPQSVQEFLSPKNTPLRGKWYKKSYNPPYRFSRDFVRSDYQRWKTMELRGFGITDSEDISGQYCRYRDSQIGKEFLSDEEIEGRCCVCGIGGEWQCQYSHVKADRQCQAPDILIQASFEEDPSFSGIGQKKFRFTGIAKNQSDITSNNILISVLLNQETIATQRISGLRAQQQQTFSEEIFPEISRGIILPTGDHELTITALLEEFEEPNTLNNAHTETITVRPPLHDFLIESVNISQTGNRNDEEQEELQFEVIVKNKGEPFSFVPEEYLIQVLKDPGLPPQHEEIVSEPVGRNQTHTSVFSFFEDEGDHLYFLQVIPLSEDEKDLENNILEIPFRVVPSLFKLDEQFFF